MTQPTQQVTSNIKGYRADQHHMLLLDEHNTPINLYVDPEKFDTQDLYLAWQLQDAIHATFNPKTKELQSAQLTNPHTNIAERVARNTKPEQAARRIRHCTQ